MQPLPQLITNSGLWKKVSEHDLLRGSLQELRAIAGAVGAQAARVLPSYTDHSIKHMDALWALLDEVFTSQEIQSFTVGEAFVLGCSFYVHDLGMAIACTSEGLAKIQKSQAYLTVYDQLRTAGRLGSEEAANVAVQIASREVHAHIAQELLDQPLPGIQRYLIENSEVREKWASYIADVAASHHWSLTDVDRKLGSRGRVPDSLGGELDLAFLACSLRIVDYAHINSDRATFLDRVLRSRIASDSLLYWKAQEHITGPRRQEDRLVFGCTRPIRDVDAWWLFYETACGLDGEITAVGEYLSMRTVSQGRYTLEGVKGVRTPQAFAALVQPEGFEPVDVRFRPHSLERLTELLGGRTLYGNDFFAPLRELLQNARDATLLQQYSDTAAGETPRLAQIAVTLESNEKHGLLSISDEGTGMTAKVITNYLLGIAADYWNSSDYHTAYPSVAGRFRPAGRFGIGFLSVFMIGSPVEVETQHANHPRLTLKLQGIGRRGALLQGAARVRTGTSVRVVVPREKLREYDDLASVVRAKAPMLELPVSVSQVGQTTTFTPGWWSRVPQDELHDFVVEWERFSFLPASQRRTVQERGSQRYVRHLFTGERSASLWPGRQPEIVTDTYRLLAIPSADLVILCSKGIAVASVRIRGLTGLVEAGDLELNASRSQLLNWDGAAFRTTIIDRLQPELIRATESISTEGSTPERFQFLARVAQTYGAQLLTETKLPWITVIEPPGHAILLPPYEFANRVSEASDVLIGFGLNPWVVSRRCRELYPEASTESLIVAISNDGQPSFGSYRDEDKTIRGPLDTHFNRGPYQDYETEPWKGAVLLTSAIEIVARTWKVEPACLMNSKWCRRKQEFICGHITRAV